MRLFTCKQLGNLFCTAQNPAPASSLPRCHCSSSPASPAAPDSATFSLICQNKERRGKVPTQNLSKRGTLPVWHQETLLWRSAPPAPRNPPAPALPTQIHRGASGPGGAAGRSPCLPGAAPAQRPGTLTAFKTPRAASRLGAGRVLSTGMSSLHVSKLEYIVHGKIQIHPMYLQVLHVVVCH